MKKRLLIGIITAECHEEFQEDILRGIVSQAFKTNCDTAILAPTHNFSIDSQHKISSEEIFKLILSPRFDGFLYVRNSIYSENVKNMVDGLLIRSEKPVMLLDCEEHRLFDSTAVDDCSAFEQITDHLVNVHGLKKIICLTGPKNAFVSEERLKGFKVSMKKHGLFCDKSTCLYGDFWENAANKLADDIISGRIERPEAVVCGNDHSANTLIKALQKGGIRVPEDIAVTGYDDSDEGRQNTPSLTSYRRPNFQLGAEAFRRIFRIITGKICLKVHDENGNLMLRQSCGCENPPEKNFSRRERLNLIYENDILNRDMMFTISNNSEISDFADALDNFTYYIYKLKHLYICVTKKYIESCNGDSKIALSFDTGDEMEIILSKSAVKREYLENTTFSSADILPDYDAERPYPVSFFITPLNFNDNFFGYSAVSFGKIPMTFSKIYNHFINYVDTALEQLRLRSIIEKTTDNAYKVMMYDEMTGLPNRTGVIRAFAEQYADLQKINPTADFIRIQLTGINETSSQDDEKYIEIISSFAEFIHSAIKESEIFGLWTAYSFAIITTYKERYDEIFAHLCEKVRDLQFFERYSINFTVGVSSAEISSYTSPENELHKASLNRVHYFTASERKDNPQYDKLCVLRSRIMKNPEQPWNINSIAESLYLSKSYLQKIYKQYFGKSIIEEMIFFRIEKAKEYLLNTDMTVTEIAKQCGYSSYNYFVRQFKALEGAAPTDFRSG